MFASRYFAPRYFAPRYFPPAVDVVVEPPVTGGGGHIQKPEYYTKVISFTAPSETIKYEVQPIKLEETSADYQKEMDRYGFFIDELAKQIEAKEIELKILEAEQVIEQQIKYELLRLDIMAARAFIDELIDQIYQLLLLKRRRQDEEAIIAILIADS